MKLKTACLQYPVLNGNIAINEETYLEKLTALKGHKIDLIVLPEMCFSGFDYSDLKEHSKKTPAILENISKIVDAHSFVFTSLAETIDNKIYNTVFIISSEGIIEKYSKNMLFTSVNEHLYFTPSKGVKTFHLNSVNVTTFLCYEIRFPELIRIATYRNNIDIIIIPAIWPYAKIDHWTTLLKARAIENHCFVVGCNASYVTTKNKNIKCGNSLSVDPWGNILSTIEKDNTLISELDMALIEKTKNSVPSLEQAKKCFSITFK